MKEPKLIAQFGTFEVENYGDLLFPIILKKELSSRIPSFKLQLYSPLDKMEHVHPIFQKDGSLTPFSEETIILGGGDIISFSTNITSEYKRNWHNYIGPHTACWTLPSIYRAKTAKLLWNAPGVPFPFTKEQAVLVRTLMPQSDYISVRDEISKNHLKNAGVLQEIHIVPDTALLLPKHFSLESLKPIAKGLLAPFGLALGEPLVFQLQPGLEQHISQITELLQALSNKLKRKVLLLPIGYCHNDQQIISKIYLQSNGLFHIIQEKLDCSQTAAIIAHAGCFVGTSLHGNITAYAYGVPHLIFNAYDLSKLVGFSKLIEEPERLILNYNEIFEKAHLLSRPPSRTIYQNLTDQIEQHFDRMSRYIMHPSPANESGKSNPDIFEGYLSLMLDQQKNQIKIQSLEQKIQEYDSFFLIKEVIAFRQFYRKLKRTTASFKTQNFWVLRLMIFLTKFFLRNIRKFFKLIFKRLFILLENYPIKILPLDQWNLMLHSGTAARSLLYRTQEDLHAFPHKPLISLILTVYNTSQSHLKEAIESVLNQYYNNWELCIADNGLNSPEIRELLEELQKSDPRIKVVFLSSNKHRSSCCNAAIELSSGEYVALLEPNDTLSPDALYEMIRKIHLYPQADFIYSDEDQFDSNGFYSEPFYKPDWCPDSFLSRNYIQHFALIRRELVNRVGGFRIDFEEAYDYDLFLRITELSDHIYHIPKILYHTRRKVPSPQKATPEEAGRQALNEAISRRNWNAQAEHNLNAPGCFTVRYQPNPARKVSIIIPTKNQASVLKKCIDSVYTKTSYINFEVIVVSNNSTEGNLFLLLENYKRLYREKFNYYESNIPFNYSRLMNEAVAKVSGDLLLFLNNDTEVISNGWIEELASQSERASIGAVGCKLLYYNDTIQHAGVVMREGEGIAHHIFIGQSQDNPGYLHRINTVNNYSAVTAACMMCRKSLFYEINGFDEDLGISYNDIDFCLKLKERGYNNIYLPHVELYHYESFTRGSPSATKKTYKQFCNERKIMQTRWGKYLAYDPCHSLHLSPVGSSQE